MTYTAKELAKIQSNVWKYTVLMITNQRVFGAILGSYYLTIPNVDAQHIGIIFLFSGLAGFILEMPSGYIADKVGHKKTLVLGYLFIMLSTVMFLFSTNFIMLICGAILISAGIAFNSGSNKAFLHDTLIVLGKDHDYSKIAGKASSIGAKG